MESILSVDQNGCLSFVYSDELASMVDDLGPATVRRASHVEPCDGGWTADMGPVGGGVLGPFKRHGEAISAELAWLREHKGI